MSELSTTTTGSRLLSSLLFCGLALNLPFSYCFSTRPPENHSSSTQASTASRTVYSPLVAPIYVDSTYCYSEAGFWKQLRTLLGDSGGVVFIDSTRGSVVDNMGRVEIEDVFVSSSQIGWVSSKLFGEIVVDRSRSISFVQENETPLFSDTLENIKDVLNRGDTLTIINANSSYVLVSAKTLDPASNANVLVIGLVPALSTGRAEVEIYPKRKMCIRSQFASVFDCANDSCRPICNFERGDQVWPLKVRGHWTYVEYVPSSCLELHESVLDVNKGWILSEKLSEDYVKREFEEEKRDREARRDHDRRVAEIETALKRHLEWSESDRYLIRNHQFRLGMTAEQVRLSKGAPSDINRSVGAWGVHEQWVYRSDLYLYFENGVLTSYQE